MPYALITGASKGIGKEIAVCLAARKYDLLLVARSERSLEELSASLRREYAVQVSCYAADLSTPHAAKDLAAWVAENNFPVAVLVNNAGYGLWGNFDELSWESQENMLQLNVTTLAELTYRMIPVLRLQPGQKYILNVGSMAGLQSVPTLNMYAATKAFVNNFTRGLAWELKDKQISVSLLAPGSVRTNFIERSGMQHMAAAADKLSMNPDEIARIAVNSMLHGKREITPGLSNRFSAAMVKLLPKSWIEKIAGSLYKKK